ncbi:ring-hydroxylating oxygenase subunit alpha [Helicobacter aurati]|uniref:Ring-hydroxylating oxygenase subunit alpha n=1 Tax=Helicobacter aurati TaxID=137778 RepID=A0A3D8J4H9_9HELI|nr:ring-hydroxylating oxygenase subunit alpha [Helicobacter aurati]RDU72389.1 ring-hydroxylating oxygenase subunit alpha [Helicobacter aurati]
MSKPIHLPKDFCKSAKEAYTLPADCYIDPNVFSHEIETIFTKDWICVAHASEVNTPNQYITREILNESVLIIRGRDNILRAFYNVCPHRAHRIVEGDGSARSLTCPYHAWAFNQDGTFASARNCNNVHNFNKHDACLTPIQCEEYAGFIFINLDSKCTKTVQDQLPGLKESFEQALPNAANYKRVARFTTRTPANWKNIVDNYMECYHCAPAHPGFANSVQVDKYWHKIFKNWSLQWGVAIPSDKSFQFEGESSFSGFWLWPCTMWNVNPVGMLNVIFEFPIDSETTLQNYDIFLPNEDLTQQQKDLIEWYRTVFRPEDLRLVESVQKGLHSRGYKGQGRIMADYNDSGISEHGIAFFHNLVAARY